MLKSFSTHLECVNYEKYCCFDCIGILCTVYTVKDNDAILGVMEQALDIWGHTLVETGYMSKGRTRLEKSGLTNQLDLPTGPASASAFGIHLPFGSISGMVILSILHLDFLHISRNIGER